MVARARKVTCSARTVPPRQRLERTISIRERKKTETAEIFTACPAASAPRAHSTDHHTTARKSPPALLIGTSPLGSLSTTAAPFLVAIALPPHISATGFSFFRLAKSFFRKVTADSSLVLFLRCMHDAARSSGAKGANPHGIHPRARVATETNDSTAGRDEHCRFPTLVQLIRFHARLRIQRARRTRTGLRRAAAAGGALRGTLHRSAPPPVLRNGPYSTNLCAKRETGKKTPKSTHTNDFAV